MSIGGDKPRPCPVCHKPVAPGAPERPFCCARCQKIDLGRWAGGDYQIAGDPAMPWEMEAGDD